MFCSNFSRDNVSNFFLGKFFVLCLVPERGRCSRTSQCSSGLVCMRFNSVFDKKTCRKPSMFPFSIFPHTCHIFVRFFVFAESERAICFDKTNAECKG